MKEYIVAVPEHLAGDLFKGDPMLIRCKDCKWYEFDEPHRCGFGGHGLRGKSDYCSDAERKEE